MIKYLGRKFLMCAGTIVAVIVGSRFAPADTFNAASVAIVAIVGIFCGSNTLAGLPGKPPQGRSDGP